MSSGIFVIFKSVDLNCAENANLKIQTSINSRLTDTIRIYYVHLLRHCRGQFQSRLSHFQRSTLCNSREI